MNTRQRTLAYNLAYYAGMAWAMAGAFWAVSTGVVTAESPIVAKLTLIGILVGPCVLLWAWKRWYTGRWLN